MSRHTVILDDIDESPDAQPVTFSLDGKSYEIDLASENTDALRAALEPYIAAGRRAGTSSKKSSSPKSAAADTSSGPDSSEVRAWARANGIEVSDRGRVSADIVNQYLAAS